MARIDAEHMQYSRLRELQPCWPHDLPHRVLPVATVGLVADRNRPRTRDHLPGAAGYGFLRRMGGGLGSCGLAPDEHCIPADAAALFALADVGAPASSHRTVLYGRNDPFRDSILARSGW